MPDYSKAIIYKLVCKDFNISDIYVGSTCNFNRRKTQHKSTCYNEKDKNYNSRVYEFIRNNGGFDNWDMIMVEEYSCENKRQKEKRERFWMESLKSTLNERNPSRSRKEWQKEYNSRPEIKERQKEYNSRPEIKERQKEYIKEYLSRPEVKERNKERQKEYDSRPEVKERQKEYDSRPEVKERKKEYIKEYYSRPEIKERQKEYYSRPEVKEKRKEYDSRPEVKERKKEYDKQYREKNKEELKKKYTCICGSTLRRDGKRNHEKSKKHQKFIESQNE